MSTEPLSPTDDKMGRLLRDYFESRMPAFPPSAVVVAEPARIQTSPHRSLLARGRWVMAVAVALVACALGFLAAQNPPGRLAPSADLNRASGKLSKFPAVAPARSTPASGPAAK
jgi:hypothetical protein